MSNHVVRLPHPHREGFTTGHCECGTVVMLYEWGEHEWAVDVASEHIMAAAQAAPIETVTLNGDRTVLAGRSL